MYLQAIARARHDILKDNEEPRDILISADLKHAIRQECGNLSAYDFEIRGDQLMGMKVEWTKPKPLTAPQISIRTRKGDTRIVNMLSR